MFQRIKRSFNDYCDNVAMIFCSHDRILSSRTYKDVKHEAEQIIQVFKEFPKGIVVAVRLGHKPCLLPVIYSLLQYEIAFMLFEEEENLENVHDVYFHASVTCKIHGDENIQQRQLKHGKNTLLMTNLGCEYNICQDNLLNCGDNRISNSYNGICYVVSTSGTLGRRKVVRVTENSIFSNIKSFRTKFEISNSDVIYFGTPLSFDPSLVELFLALLTGACLLATTNSTRNNPTRLLQVLFSQEFKAKRVTFMQMCPSLFLQFSTEQIDFILNESRLRVLGLGGEPFPSHILQEKSTSNCKIYNFYGITEVSCWASVDEVFHGKEVSLGVPLEDTIFQLHDDEGNVINDWESKENCEGILYIETKTRICYVESGLAIMNEGKPEKAMVHCTGDVVKVQNGKLFYKGRADDIIKRFGRRICLLKVQESVYKATQLANICIFYKEKVICFLQIEDLGGQQSANTKQQLKDIIIDKIRVKLRKDLAAESIPDLYDIVTSFPVKRINGKVDKIALEHLADGLFVVTSVDIVRSRESVFSDLWWKYLGSDGTLKDLKKTFWESGGNSILAMQFAEEFQKLTQGTLNRSLFDLPFESALDFLHCDGFNPKKRKEGGRLKVLWKSNMNACIDSTPVVVKFGENVYVAVGNFAHMFSVFDGNTGHEVASITLPNVVESACLVLVSSQHFLVPCFDGKLYCLRLCLSDFDEKNTGKSYLKIVWSFQTQDRLKNKPIFDENEQNILFGSYDGYVYALTKEGSLQWKTLIVGPILGEIKISHGNGIGKLYVAALKGSIFCLNAKSGGILWKHIAKNPLFAGPELSQTKMVLFLDIEACFYCFSIETDQMLWLFDTQAEVASVDKQTRTFASMFLEEQANRICVGTQDGIINVYVFDRVKCSLLPVNLNFKLTNIPITTRPLHMKTDDNEKDYLIVVNSIGCLRLYLVDLNKLEVLLLDEYSLPNECFSSPQKCISYENRFYLGCRDNYLYCIEVIK